MSDTPLDERLAAVLGEECEVHGCTDLYEWEVHVDGNTRLLCDTHVAAFDGNPRATVSRKF